MGRELRDNATYPTLPLHHLSIPLTNPQTPMDSKSLRFITHQSLFSAVRSGDLASIRQLIEAEGPDLMALRNDAGETAIYIAAENNFVEVFEYLLLFCHKETLLIRCSADVDAFHAAAKRGHLDSR